MLDTMQNYIGLREMTLAAEATHSLDCVIFTALLLEAGAELHTVLPLVLKDAAGSL